MSAALSVRRYKDKNYLAKNTHCEPYFFAKVRFFFKSCRFYPNFTSYSLLTLIQII